MEGNAQTQDTQTCQDDTEWTDIGGITLTTGTTMTGGQTNGAQISGMTWHGNKWHKSWCYRQLLKNRVAALQCPECQSVNTRKGQGGTRTS